ncbi:MAG: hypothetical protein HY308_04580 [Gammaproteobacteria bacterium]|nr:hypothetical protein [Gammaproteobacteria bacterium]
MSKTKMFKSVAVVLAALLSVCLISSCSVEAKLAKYPGLKERVAEYYAAEQRNDWEQSYVLRTPAFQKETPKETYIAVMRRDTTGWKLKGYEINAVKEKNGEVVLFMTFYQEGPPNNFYNELARSNIPPNTPPITTLELQSESSWAQLDGKWYVHVSGQRLHLTFDGPLGINY